MVCRCQGNILRGFDGEDFAWSMVRRTSDGARGLLTSRMMRLEISAYSSLRCRNDLLDLYDENSWELHLAYHCLIVN